MAESFTNQAREQAESKSSFFKREKLLSGFRSKRSRITGVKFKKGTSQESSDNIESRVTANEKKITLLKNIVQLRKVNVDKESGQMGSPLLESLQSIASTTDSIRNSLIEQQDRDKGAAEKARLQREKEDREKQEKGLEKKPSLVEKMAAPVLKPVMSLWDKIWKFISTLFLGKLLMNFLDWVGNPANQDKIKSFVRFIGDWWPALTAAVLLFGTGFGSLVAGLAASIAWFIPAMGSALASLKAAKWMSAASMIPGGGKVAAIAKTAALVGGGMFIGSQMGDGPPETEISGYNKGGQVPGSGPDKDTVPAMLTPGEFVMSRGAVQQYGVDTLEGMNAAAGGTNIPTLKNVAIPQYNEGGKVQSDTSHFGTTGYRMGQVLPDQFTYNLEKYTSSYKTKGGEVIEDKETYTELGGSIGMPDLIEHQTQLVDSLRNVEGYEDINFMDVVQYPDGRGRLVGMPKETLFPILNSSDAWKASDAKRDAAIRIDMESGTQFLDPTKTAKAVGLNGGGLVQGFQGGGFVTPMQQMSVLREERKEILRRQVNGKMSKEDRKRYRELTAQIKEVGKKINPKQRSTPTPTVTPKVPKTKTGSGLFGGIKRVVGGTADQLTGNLFDFDKRSDGGLVRKTVGAVGGLFGGGKKEDGVKKTSGSSGILGPISSNIDAMVNTDKYEVKPKEKKNVIVALEQEANQNKSETQEQAPAGNDIPTFEVAPIRDPLKMEILDIVVF